MGRNYYIIYCIYSNLIRWVCVTLGGSILSTRCSETYETKTALMSLFGLPLWYFYQSPRVVIQVRLLGPSGRGLTVYGQGAES